VVPFLTAAAPEVAPSRLSITAATTAIAGASRRAPPLTLPLKLNPNPFAWLKPKMVATQTSKCKNAWATESRSASREGP